MGSELRRAKGFRRMLASAVLLAASLPLPVLAAQAEPAAEAQRATPQAHAGAEVDAAALEALERADALASQGQVGAEFIRAVQTASEAFDRVEVGLAAGKSHWRLYSLNAEGASFDGLRFKTPADGPRRIVWSFVCRPHSRWRTWNIVPAAGLSGAPRYYSFIRFLNDVAIADVEFPVRNHMELQASVGTLEPAREYILWFDFRDEEPEDFWVAMKLMPAGTVVGANPSAFARVLGLKPLDIHLASKLGLIESAREYLDKDPEAVRARTADGKTPLHHAVAYGGIQVAELLLSRDADPEAVDMYGQRPLHWAVQSGSSQGARLLIKHGADIRATRGDGCDPLQAAAQRGYTDVAAVLLEADIKVDTTGDTGRTPLSYAAEHGRGRMARFLLDHGADVNAAPRDGLSALHRAAVLGDEDLLELLLAAGAHVNAPGPGGRSPLDYAVASGSRAATEVLQRHGGTGAVPVVASVASMEHVVPGEPGPCVRLDNYMSHLLVEHNESLDFIGAFTAEVWVYLSRHVPGVAAVITRDSPELGPWQLLVEDGVLTAQVAQYNWHPVPPDARYGPLPPHQWLHVAMVYDKQEVRVFVNGTRVAVHPAPDSIKATLNDLTIGRSHYTGRALNGFIREVRVSDTARYSQDFTPQWRFEPDANTIVLLHCDEGEGDVAHDSSGRQSNAKIIRASWARQ